MTLKKKIRERQWTDLKSYMPYVEGQYEIKNDDMEGVGIFTGDGWAVIGEWKGPITHWRRPTCQ